MPIYEGKSVIQEKPALIFDIGFAYTKFGFASESSPRCIIPSKIKCEKTGKIKLIHEYNDSKDLYDTLVDFIHYLCFRYGLVSPKDRKAVIVESLLCPTIFRETLAKVLFCHFEINGILFLPSHTISLSTLAVETALVVDLGYKEAVCIPVYCGVAVLHAWQAQPLCGIAIHDKIRKEITPQLPSDTELKDEILEDIAVRTCFVTTLERAQKYREGNPPAAPPSVTYPLGGSIMLNISGELRETACEELFPIDNDQMGLGNMILDAILKCPIDMRVQLAQNILLIGGISMTQGIRSRIKAELLHLSMMEKYKNVPALKVFKFHTAPSKQNYTAWLGGAIYGGTDMINSRPLTKEMYSKNPHVPDWSNLADNLPENVNETRCIGSK